MIDPGKGNVVFGSGLHGWAFSLKQFAELYAFKFQIKKKPKKLMKLFWGDNWCTNPKYKWNGDKWEFGSAKWIRNKPSGDGFIRGFNMFFLDPIYKVLSLTLKYGLSYN